MKSMFTMDDCNAIQKMELEEAKIFLRSIVQESTANSNNTAKARSMIDRAFSVRKLMLGVSNFIMAHPSERLKVIA